jgi:molybdenum cofactor guanylyltransferase
VTLVENNNLSKPVLYGLVLAGGRSIRMGQDKGAMNWHGKEQKYFVADMLQDLCDHVFISCRPEQQADIAEGYHAIVDSVEGSGPIIAILSALSMHPDAAWLVVACDLPLIDMPTLQQLIANRNVGGLATTFSSPFDGLPEPLITIWEPESLKVLQNHYSNGFKCPRKALILNGEYVNIIQPDFPDALLNTNTPEDAERVSRIISDR